ncbi:ABC transporter permease [Rhodococcus sp. HNM0569]|nr:ABC transporter permease [Rhodococcus sp. HNM0569]
MLWRNLLHTVRNPDSMLTAVLLPVMLLLLFVYVFGGAMNTGTDYLNYVVPGIILLCAAFGASTTAVSVSTDMSEGIVDRFRTLPITQVSVLTGHVLGGLVRNLVSTAIVFAIALLMGFRPTAGPLDWLAVLGLVALFILVIGVVSAALGMLARSPEAAGGFTFFIMFVPYVSSAFVPTDTMPSWLHGFAEHQPMTPVIETMRSLLTDGSAGPSLGATLAWLVGLGAAGIVAAAVVFRRRVSRRG